MKKQTITLLATATIAGGFLLQAEQTSAAEKIKVEQQSPDELAKIEQTLKVYQDQLQKLNEESSQLENNIVDLKQTEKENNQQLEIIYKDSKETDEKLTQLKEKEDSGLKNYLESETEKIKQEAANTDQEIAEVNTEIGQRDIAFKNKVEYIKYFRNMAVEKIKDPLIFKKYIAESQWLNMTSPDYYPYVEKVKGMENNIKAYQNSIAQLKESLASQYLSDELKQEISETIQGIQNKLDTEINELPAAKKGLEESFHDLNTHYEYHPDTLANPILAEIRELRAKDDLNRFGHENAVLYLHKKGEHLQKVAQLDQKILAELEAKLIAVPSISHQEEINKLTKHQQGLKQQADLLGQKQQEISQKLLQVQQEKADKQKQIEQLQLRISELENSKATLKEKQISTNKDQDQHPEKEHVQKPELDKDHSVKPVEAGSENIAISQIDSPINQQTEKIDQTKEVQEEQPKTEIFSEAISAKKKTKGKLQIKLNGKWLTYNSRFNKKLSSKATKARAKATVISKKAVIVNALGKKRHKIKLGKKVKIYAIKKIKQKIFVKIGFNKWLNIKYLVVK